VSQTLSYKVQSQERNNSDRLIRYLNIILTNESFLASIKFIIKISFLANIML